MGYYWSQVSWAQIDVSRRAVGSWNRIVPCFVELCAYASMLFAIVSGCRAILPDPTNAANVPGSRGNGGAEVTPEVNHEGLSPKVKAMWSLPGAKVLVIVNPKSGHGKAKKVLCSHVLPVFELAGLRYSVLETSCPRHAERLAAAADLSMCSDGIVCVGGDGIVNEVLNGLFSRKDSAQAMEVPIGIIPAGSDNSLCWSVLGIRDPISAAISIVKSELDEYLSFQWYWSWFPLHLLGFQALARRPALK
ncbi:hypothetical protein CBR_g39942 [Chara braunii]|uniref:DAGKc domain-containing protein n=1 Tax=Chara braunii TaxID=69332 RepID=A0A388K1L5_CHABU|nr:hypothetical protein CBR_g39942 [Chara braunii]|eukprot:GBG63938.1 hypothetical protein CBR_g39942 [Chara braunii]